MSRLESDRPPNGQGTESIQPAVILIVEDDLFIREIAEMTLRGWGYRTLLAGDVEEAALLLRSDETIDAIFTDIYLKAEVHGGCTLAHLAQELRPSMRVLYTTGNIVTAKIGAMLVNGADCLRKPYSPLQLQQSLEGLLAARV